MKGSNRVRWGIAGVALAAAGGVPAGAGVPGASVVAALRSAYVLSFRSPDLTTHRPDERWGRKDGRLYAGRIVTDFPVWLRWKEREIWEARVARRPIVLSLHVHSGFGTGLVTYTKDLKKAEAVNYPWLIRQLERAGLNGPDVTVTIDTCNAQATAAHQLRPDLVPGGVAAFGSFARWRKAHPLRLNMEVGGAYRLYSLDRVRQELARSARGSRANVLAVPYKPLTDAERGEIQCELYGPKGVVVSTPALFNLLRLGPERLKATNTAHLLRDRLELRILGDNTLPGNNRELRRFTDYRFLANAGIGPERDAWHQLQPVRRAAEDEERPPAPPAAGRPAPGEDSER